MVKKRKHEASEPAKAEKAEISPINTASEIKFETSPASKKSKNSVSFKKSSSRKGSRSSDSKPQIKQEVSASQPPKPQNWQGPTTGHNFKIKQENALLDPCPICQNEIDHYTSIATPSTCLNHIFCVDCLLTWTKKSNICPMDRQPYDQVYIFESYYKKICQETDLKENGKNVEEFIQPDRILTVDKSGEKLKGDQAVDVIQSTPADQFVYSDDEELTAEETEAMIWENLFCLVCHDNDREEILLLCDGCDDCYHSTCLDPPLIDIPEGDWYCDNCLSANLQDVRSSIGNSRRTRSRRPASTTQPRAESERAQANRPTSRPINSSDILINSVIDQLLTEIDIGPSTASRRPARNTNPRTESRQKAGRALRRKRKKSRKTRGKSKAKTPKRNIPSSDSGFQSSSSTGTSVIPLSGQVDIYGSNYIGPDSIEPENATADAPKPRLISSDYQNLKILDRKQVNLNILPCPYRVLDKLPESKLDDDFDLDQILSSQSAMMQMKTKNYGMKNSSNRGHLQAARTHQPPEKSRKIKFETPENYKYRRPETYQEKPEFSGQASKNPKNSSQNFAMDERKNSENSKNISLAPPTKTENTCKNNKNNLKDAQTQKNKSQSIFSNIRGSNTRSIFDNPVRKKPSFFDL